MRFDLPGEKVPGTQEATARPVGSPHWSRSQGRWSRQKMMRMCTREEEVIGDRDENEDAVKRKITDKTNGEHPC